MNRIIVCAAAFLIGVQPALALNDTIGVTAGTPGKTANLISFASTRVISEVGICDATTENLCATINADGSVTISGAADEAAWTAGTSRFTPGGGVFNDSAAALTSGQQGMFRLSAVREIYTTQNTLKFNSGNTGTALCAAGTINCAAGVVIDTAGNNVFGNLGDSSNCTPGSTFMSLFLCSLSSNKIQGVDANGATVTGNPVLEGGRAQTAEITAVTDGQAVRAAYTVAGKPINLPYANPENTINATPTSAITNTASTQVLAAIASFRNYATWCKVVNSHATVGTFVNILDGSTVVDTMYAGPAGGGERAVYPTPIRGSVNTALNCQPATTGSNTVCLCGGFKGT